MYPKDSKTTTGTQYPEQSNSGTESIIEVARSLGKGNRKDDLTARVSV